MVSMAVSHRQVAVGAYERIARLTGMLCRLGVVLAILQLASWSVVYWDDFDQSEALASARHASRMQAVDNVVAPSVAMLVITTLVKVPRLRVTESSSPSASAERSSTNKVGTMLGCTRNALSTMLIMASRISVVAVPDPATMPRVAHAKSDRA